MILHFRKKNIASHGKHLIHPLIDLVKKVCHLALVCLKQQIKRKSADPENHIGGPIKLKEHKNRN